MSTLSTDQLRAPVSHDNFHDTQFMKTNVQNFSTLTFFFSLFSKTETNEKDEKIITLTSQLKELLQRVAMEEKLRKDMERLVILQS